MLYALSLSHVTSFKTRNLLVYHFVNKKVFIYYIMFFLCFETLQSIQINKKYLLTHGKLFILSLVLQYRKLKHFDYK